MGFTIMGNSYTIELYFFYTNFCYTAIMIYCLWSTFLMKTIFVVDDNTVNLVVADEALSNNYNVFTFVSAQVMLDSLNNIIPDLILLDIMMPGMDGFETLKHLKANRQYAEIPVIFMTSKEDAGTKALGYQMGVADFIFKPFLESVLLSRIIAHLPIEVIDQEN